MISYKIDGIRKGQLSEDYGQGWWATSPDTDMSIAFSSKTYTDLDTMIEKGPFQIVAEDKKVINGEKGDFLSLRKVKLIENEEPTLVHKETGEVRPLQTDNKPTQLDRIESELQELHVKLDKLMGPDAELTPEDLDD